MRVELVQRAIHWEQPERNFAELDSAFEAKPPEPGTLLVLAEMFAAGFTLAVDSVGEPDQGATSAYMRDLARRYEVAVVGSFPHKVEGRSKGLNRLLAFGPSGEPLATYDKIHPFSYGKEADHYVGGRSLTVFEYQGWKICPTVCYDLRFPEIYRRATLEGGAELFLVVANWPSARRAHWTTLLRARAIENQCYVAAVNRIGEDPNTSYSGDSALIDPKGQALLDLGDRASREAAVISRSELEQWRSKFPALADATEDYDLLTPR